MLAKGTRVATHGSSLTGLPRLYSYHDLVTLLDNREFTIDGSDHVCLPFPGNGHLKMGDYAPVDLLNSCLTVIPRHAGVPDPDAFNSGLSAGGISATMATTNWLTCIRSTSRPTLPSLPKWGLSRMRCSRSCVSFRGRPPMISVVAGSVAKRNCAPLRS